jgi:hypothetical protein
MANKKTNRPLKVSKSIPLEPTTLAWYEQQAISQSVPTAQLMRRALVEFMNDTNNFLSK